jgi:hypothetical protein
MNAALLSEALAALQAAEAAVQKVLDSMDEVTCTYDKVEAQAVAIGDAVDTFKKLVKGA